MDERWTIGVVEALRKLCRNGPECINYNLRSLETKSLVKCPDPNNTNSYEDVVPLKKQRTMRTLIYSNNFECGSLVWAKYGDQWWPGIIIEKFPENTSEKKYIVFWMSERTVSQVSIKNIIDFADNFNAILHMSFKKMNNSWKDGVVTTLNELYNYKRNFENKDLNRIVASGLFEIPQRENCVPSWVENILTNNESNVENLGSIDKKTACPATIKRIIEEKLETSEILSQVCLACYTTNGVDCEHPLFKGNVCRKCLGRLKSTMVVKGDDGLHYFCAVCGTLGLIVLCDNDNCGRAYCFQCISDLTANNTWDILLTTEEWLCFLCEDSSVIRIIYGRDDYSTRIHQLYTPERLQLVEPPSEPLPSETKLRVLSLFDGISTGFYSLQKLKIPIQAYYASEIDIAALNISKLNFGDQIIQMGDVISITDEIIKEISPIHLLIGGSPCNDLSLANPTRKGLFDGEGSGILFFEFYRIILLLKKYNKDGFYWMYENVSSMQLSCREAISLYLQCEPVLKDAVSFSPQHRPRLFWGNLPTLYVEVPFEKTHLQEFLMSGRMAIVPKLKTVTTKSNSLRQGKEAVHPVRNEQDIPDTIWITELEKVFGLPQHYTDAGNLSATQRQELLGKSWSIPVITHLFNFLHSFCTSSSYKITSSPNEAT